MIADCAFHWLENRADARLTSGDDYGLSHRWSKAIHDHHSRPDGILYRARHDPSRLSAAIFERVGPVLEVLSDTSFLDPAYAVQLGRILDDYRFGLIPYPRIGSCCLD